MGGVAGAPHKRRRKEANRELETPVKKAWAALDPSKCVDSSKSPANGEVYISASDWAALAP